MQDYESTFYIVKKNGHYDEQYTNQISRGITQTKKQENAETV